MSIAVNLARVGVKIVVTCALFVGAVHFFNAARDAEAQAPSLGKIEPATCHNEWRLCKDNAEFANSHNSDFTGAAIDCEQRITDNAKYGEPQWPRFPFDSYVPGDSIARNGTIILVENNVKLSNEYGAMQKTFVRCYYDLEQKKVTSTLLIH